MKTKGLKGKVDEDAENESGTDVTEYQGGINAVLNLLHSMQKDLGIVKQENKLIEEQLISQQEFTKHQEEFTRHLDVYCNIYRMQLLKKSINSRL